MNRGSPENAGIGAWTRRWLPGLAVLAALTAPAGWVVTDRLERDNDFCNACHLSAEVPLHSEIRSDFDARPAGTLAAAHAALAVDPRPGPAGFRCIDCHGGVSFQGRVRVKVLAAKDAFWWLVGHFEEPDGMRWPLWDEDCRQCHSEFAGTNGPQGNPAFHELSVHNVNLGVDCVQCHLSHEKGGNVGAHFLHPEHVRAECAKCHSEFEETP